MPTTPLPDPNAPRVNRWTKLPCGHRVHHAKADPPPPCPHCVSAPRRITGEPPGWEGTRALHDRLYVKRIDDLLTPEEKLRLRNDLAEIHRRRTQAEDAAAQTPMAAAVVPESADESTPLPPLGHRARPVMGEDRG